MEKWWQLDGWRRQAALYTAVLVGTVLLGALIGSQLGIDGGTGSTPSANSRLEPLAPGTLEELPKATPSKLEDPLVIGSQNAGVAVVGSSEPDSIDTKDGERRAPDGGSLVVFTLADWGCENPPCKPWTTLKPQIQADGLVKDVPTDGDTFVIAVPAGTSSLRLVVEDSGYKQTISLLDDDPGSRNIALLAQKNGTKKLDLNKSVALTENTDIDFREPNGALVNQFTRDATVVSAQRRFFYGEERPSAPGKAFLLVTASYAYPGKTQRYAFAAPEVHFVDDEGNSYDVSSPAAAGSSVLTFEIPGSVRSGSLVFGGSTAKTASNGVPYTSTLTEARVPIKFG
ncbi:hypothetical protein [Nocardioides marmorisolisilvae]|uniref:Uncharacterized protein n=1 Tax=Nocardioides marmorisolisilvae TaxID=1542737 RepID=A0A3N0DSF1_9ACTN|nr:hypothetical protein [Nocardioides marmorisolisilvae]RNL78416.1 hypothetical protein EFL95_04770 [Nocardioides marmorisolisilvae]